MSKICKYCGNEMKLDDEEYITRNICIGKWYLCSCGGALYLKKVYGLWIPTWTKEGEE